MMAISVRRPTLDEVNQAYTGFMIGWGAIVGSVISFLFSGAVLWAFVRLYQGKIRFVRDREVLLIGAAFALFFVAEALTAAFHFAGTQTLYELAESLPFLGFLFPYSRLAVSSRRDVLRALEIGVLSGAFATSAYALVEIFLLNSTRAEAQAGNPGPFALICAILYGLTLATAVRSQGATRKLAVLATLASATALVLSGMRSLWPILIIAPIIPLALFGVRLKARILARLAIAGLASVVMLGFLTSGVIQARIQKLAEDYQNIVEHEDYENSLGYRLRLWRAGVELAAEQPLVGHGPGNERQLAAERTAADGMPPITFSHFHNFVLTALVRSGIIGVGALLIMFAVPVWIAARRSRDELANFGLAMMITMEAAYLLSGSVGIMLGHDLLDALFIYGMIVASFLVLGDRSTEGRPMAASRVVSRAS